MNEYKKLSEIKSACRKVDSSATASDGFMYKCFPLFAECFIDIANNSIDILEETKKLKNSIKTNNAEIRKLANVLRRFKPEDPEEISEEISKEDIVGVNHAAELGEI